MVARHMVIHIDASSASRATRRELFATSREGFKDGPVLAGILSVLRKMLEEDQNLYAIERELTERIARGETETTSAEVKKQVTKLLLEAGFIPQKEGAVAEPGGSDGPASRKPRPKKPINPEPLPTLPFPEVTVFDIVAPTERLEIRQLDMEVVLAQTDADDEYDRRGLIAFRSEPDLVEVVSRSPLRGGRIRWRVRPRADAAIGAAGSIVATLTRAIITLTPPCYWSMMGVCDE